MTPIKAVTRCHICGRRLTDPDSVKRGIGPVCWRRLKIIQKLDEFYEEHSITALETPAFEADPLPTCPVCGKVSPNPNYCPSCGAPIKTTPLEVVAT